MNMLVRLSIVSGCVVIAGIALCTVTAAESSEAPELFRSAANDGADRPTGRLLLRVNARQDEQAPANEPPVEDSEPPAEPDEPGAEDDTDETYYGQSVGKRVVFVIDVSWSMGSQDVGAGEDYDGNTVGSMTRMECVQYETVRLLRTLDESHAFDFVLLAGAEMKEPPGFPTSKPVTKLWKNQLTQCTEGARAEAIDFIQTIVMWFGTPTHAALESACNEYGSEIDNLFFLTDGAPYPVALGAAPGTMDGGGGSMGRNHKQAILEDFPGWFAPLRAYGCKLSCIHVGQDLGAGTFMQEFSAAMGAEYIRR